MLTIRNLLDKAIDTGDTDANSIQRSSSSRQVRHRQRGRQPDHPRCLPRADQHRSSAGAASALRRRRQLPDRNPAPTAAATVALSVGVDDRTNSLDPQLPELYKDDRHAGEGSGRGGEGPDADGPGGAVKGVDPARAAGHRCHPGPDPCGVALGQRPRQPGGMGGGRSPFGGQGGGFGGREAAAAAGRIREAAEPEAASAEAALRRRRGRRRRPRRRRRLRREGARQSGGRDVGRVHVFLNNRSWMTSSLHPLRSATRRLTDSLLIHLQQTGQPDNNTKVNPAAQPAAGSPRRAPSASSPRTAAAARAAVPPRQPQPVPATPRGSARRHRPAAARTRRDGHQRQQPAGRRGGHADHRVPAARRGRRPVEIQTGVAGAGGRHQRGQHAHAALQRVNIGRHGHTLTAARSMVQPQQGPQGSSRPASGRGSSVVLIPVPRSTPSWWPPRGPHGGRRSGTSSDLDPAVGAGPRPCRSRSRRRRPRASPRC